MNTAARTWLATIPGAVSGQRGYETTFAVARRLVQEFGLDREAAFGLLVEWNAKCVPPWSDGELRRMVEWAASVGAGT